MNIKEQENQLSLNINFQIILTVLLWFGVAGFIGYRLWRVNSPPQSTLLVLRNNVPVIRQSNLDTLRTSIKTIVTSNLPVVRPEPFD